MTSLSKGHILPEIKCLCHCLDEVAEVNEEILLSVHISKTALLISLMKLQTNNEQCKNVTSHPSPI